MILKKGMQMPDLIDRVCEHGYVYCPQWGCHDYIGYGAANGGMELWFDLTEQWANTDGALPMFHARLDPRSGFDGLDELTDSLLYSLDDKQDDLELEG
jgi:hypothetical protein